MSRLVRALGVGAAVGVIVLSPWAGANRVRQEPAYYVDDDQPLFVPPPTAPALAQPVVAPFIAAPRPAGGCGCDTVVINAVNEVRETEVRSGDAKAVNNAVTYVSAGYAANYENEIKVKVRQVARAISGDAIAGQTIALAGARGRCHNFVVRARNVVQDVEVRSGDAKAANHSTILVDPGVNPDKLDIRLRQHARARAGNATAGQVIGVAAPGGGPPGCGSVRVEATNLLDEVDVRVGEAEGTNDNTIRTCAEVGCAAELRELAAEADVVQLCESDGCRKEDPDAVVAALPAPSVTPAPTLVPDLTATELAVTEPTPCPRFGPRGRACRAALAAAEAAAASESPSTTPSPDPSTTPAASPPASSSPTPAPTPTPSPTPSPQQQ